MFSLNIEQYGHKDGYYFYFINDALKAQCIQAIKEKLLGDFNKIEDAMLNKTWENELTSYNWDIVKENFGNTVTVGFGYYGNESWLTVLGKRINLISCGVSLRFQGAELVGLVGWTIGTFPLWADVYKPELGVITTPLPSGMSSDWLKSHTYNKTVADNTPSLLVREWEKKEDGTAGNVISRVLVLGGITTAIGFKSVGATTEAFHETATNITSDVYKRVLNPNKTGAKLYVNEVNKKIMYAKSAEQIGKIVPKRAFAFAEGAGGLLSKLGFTSMLGKFVMPLAGFLSISQSLGSGEDVLLSQYASENTLVTAKKIDKAAYDEAGKEYWEEKYKDAYGDDYDPNSPDPYQDEEEAEKEAEKETAQLNKEIAQIQKQILENDLKNLDKTNDILEVEHIEATQLYDETLTRPEAKQQEHKQQFSTTPKTHVDVQGNEWELPQGSVGMLGAGLPAIMNETLTRLSGKNAADKGRLEQLEDHIKSLSLGLFSLYIPKLYDIDESLLNDNEKEFLEITKKINVGSLFEKFFGGDDI